MVLLHPDNCMHTHTIWALKCWHLKVWKGKKSGPTFDTVVKELHCVWRWPYICTFFKVRATSFFPVSLPELMCLGKHRDSVGSTSKSSWDSGMDVHHYLPHTHFSGRPAFVYCLLKQNLPATLFRLQRKWFSFPFHHLCFLNCHLISSLKGGISCVFIWV